MRVRVGLHLRACVCVWTSSWVVLSVHFEGWQVLSLFGTMSDSVPCACFAPPDDLLSAHARSGPPRFLVLELFLGCVRRLCRVRAVPAGVGMPQQDSQPGALIWGVHPEALNASAACSLLPHPELCGVPSPGFGLVWEASVSKVLPNFPRPVRHSPGPGVRRSPGKGRASGLKRANLSTILFQAGAQYPPCKLYPRNFSWRTLPFTPPPPPLPLGKGIWYYSSCL